MEEITSPLFLNIQSSHCNALNENLFYLDYPNIVENCRHYLGLCLGINICWMVWWFQGKWINMFAKCLTKILARSHSQIMSAAKVGRVGKWWKTLTKGRSGVRKSADKRWYGCLDVENGYSSIKMHLNSHTFIKNHIYIYL